MEKPRKRPTYTEDYSDDSIFWRPLGRFLYKAIGRPIAYIFRKRCPLCGKKWQADDPPQRLKWK